MNQGPDEGAGRAPAGVDPTTLMQALDPDALSRRPAFRALARAISDAVARGDVPAGSRLPSERALAAASGVSRGTVVAAYEVLREQGVVLRRQGSGTRVRQQTGELDSGWGPSHAAGVRARQLTRRVVTPDGSPIDLALSALAEPWSFDPAAGRSDLTTLIRHGAGHGYVPNGIAELRAAVAERLDSKGWPMVADQVAITHGAQHGISLAARLLVGPGDVVILEDPTFPGAIDAFARAGARLATVPTDRGGVDVAALGSLLERSAARVVYLVPTCHSPTGSVLPGHRRDEVAALIDASSAWLVEDEALAALTFRRSRPASISSRMRSGRRITVGSFAKEVWAGLRVGWMCADEATIDRVARWRAATDLGGGIIDQLAALDSLDGLDDRTDELVDCLHERSTLLCELIAARVPGWQFRPPEGGLSLWCELPGVDADRFARCAAGHGVAVLAGNVASVDDSHPHHVRLSFAGPSETLQLAVTRLGVAWAELVGQT